MIRAIASVDEKLGIAAPGNDPYNIPWRTTEDLRHFRHLTQGGVVLMGRDTYETLKAPLPERRNVVASHTAQILRDGFELVTDVDTFLQKNTSEAIWIIGGAALFTSALEYCDELHLTHVQGDFHCDRFFPEFADRFKVKSESEWQQSGEFTYKFAVYEKTGESTKTHR